jgi:branched-subunit amino acid transport protein AzlD
MADTIDLGSALKFQTGDARSAYSGIGSLINNILPNIYIAGGVVIFFMIILGGFTIITNAKDPHKIEEGGKTITSAIIGLLVLFASYWIIQIIQVVTGIPILNSSL